MRRAGGGGKGGVESEPGINSREKATFPFPSPSFALILVLPLGGPGQLGNKCVCMCLRTVARGEWDRRGRNASLRVDAGRATERELRRAWANPC